MAIGTVSEPTMPFGRYRGRPLTEVPRPALCYAACWEAVWPDTRQMILVELRRRGLPFGRFKGKPLHEVPRSYLAWVRETFDVVAPPYDELLAAELDLVEDEDEAVATPPIRPPLAASKKKKKAQSKRRQRA